MSDWEKIIELSLDVCKLPGDARGKWLAENCPPELLAEVKSLISDEDGADDVFESPVLFRFTDLLNEEDILESRIDQKFGNYQIIDEIGSGGMGAVYLAKRIDGTYDQNVALKVIRNSFFDSEIEHRFLREQQILASLHHSHIAKMFDGGFGESGEPYLVMEYIEGTPLLDFADENTLSIKSRLILFIKICSAVAYAHQNLIVHLDIKPSNILVDGEGEPILLDFGVAKVLENRLAKTETRARLIALTPAYASPEQLRNRPISTASDVYSLGIVLYELLTGNLPFKGESKSLPEIIESISKNDPIKPSENIKTSEHRDAESVYKILRGDVDSIILKTLQKEPDNRYRTVEQLSQDIKRYLDGMPINASPAKISYRAKKFYQRNMIPVLASALTVISLLTGLAIAGWQANVAKKQARAAAKAQTTAESEAKRSRLEEQRAKEITKFMEKIISYANPGSYAEGAKTNGEARVIDVLDEMGGRIGSEFPNQPDIQAELHHKFAEVYTNAFTRQRDPARAKQLRKNQKFHAKRAIELRRKHYGSKHELVAKDMFYLWATLSDEDPDQARTLANAIKMMRQTDPNNLNLPHMLMAYAIRLSSEEFASLNTIYKQALAQPTEESTYRTAESYYREAIRVFRKHYSEDSYSVLLAKCNLARVLALQGKTANFPENYRACRQAPNLLQLDPQKRRAEAMVQRIEQILRKDDR